MKSKTSFGELIRNLREKRGAPLRVVAAAVDIDSTMLSKLERGERFPTDEQTRKFAKYFDLPPSELQAKAIADKFLSQYGHNPAAKEALMFIKERIVTYSSNKS